MKTMCQSVMNNSLQGKQTEKKHHIKNPVRFRNFYLKHEGDSLNRSDAGTDCARQTAQRRAGRWPTVFTMHEDHIPIFFPCPRFEKFFPRKSFRYKACDILHFCPHFSIIFFAVLILTSALFSGVLLHSLIRVCVRSEKRASSWRISRHFKWINVNHYFFPFYSYWGQISYLFSCFTASFDLNETEKAALKAEKKQVHQEPLKGKIHAEEPHSRKSVVDRPVGSKMALDDKKRVTVEESLKAQRQARKDVGQLFDELVLDLGGYGTYQQRMVYLVILPCFFMLAFVQCVVVNIPVKLFFVFLSIWLIPWNLAMSMRWLIDWSRWSLEWLIDWLIDWLGIFHICRRSPQPCRHLFGATFRNSMRRIYRDTDCKLTWRNTTGSPWYHGITRPRRPPIRPARCTAPTTLNCWSTTDWTWSIWPRISTILGTICRGCAATTAGTTTWSTATPASSPSGIWCATRPAWWTWPLFLWPLLRWLGCSSPVMSPIVGAERSRFSFSSSSCWCSGFPLPLRRLSRDF